MYSISRNFENGIDDASRILDINGLLDQNPKEDEINVENSHLEARGKKNRHADENNYQEERDKKLPAVYPETYNAPIEEFDDILLYTVGERAKKSKGYRTDLLNAQSKNKKGSKGCDGAKRRRGKKIEGIDLTSLLINCAQSIAADDHRAAEELLRKIRKHSSPFGDGKQRLAHYFADGLEARLAGTGSHMYKALVSKRTTASDYLRAYYTCITSCPFFTISNFTSNKLITSKSEKSMRVHVIDFGILYGFQWPTFIQRLAEREGGPPMLRITGIDFPQPGFRPAERIEDTGRHLARYAKMFNVPFEYNAIAQKWETIKIEDLKIEKDEFVAVNCMHRADNLVDEIVDNTGVEESPRNMVLNLIRKINPDIFVHGIVNGAYGVPYFVTRFREALFRFSAVYDMLETNIPRESPERMLIENGVFGKEALNVIACEGWERVERPETYKLWQLRHLRAGFMQSPLGKKLTDSAAYKVRKFYDSDFMIDTDKQWLLMGWKGKIIYALSCWQPV
ncbi:scarecrow-like protein 9 [Phtheirospermum japonicum]|uniref:Scarecrow-like protein 9 n=1 Tax=Phtheirospermum japonicum TaxID=374723 RepID=A0A830C065_9LAMI|nr:scarecrow-like protein 9 [Phtheirospermum japonicum]